MKRQDSRATIMDYIESCVEPRKADENEELQEELKKKEEKIKSLEKKEEPKPKGAARGGRKAKKDKEDVNIEDVLKKGLGE